MDHKTQVVYQFAAQVVASRPPIGPDQTDNIIIGNTATATLAVVDAIVDHAIRRYQQLTRPPAVRESVIVADEQTGQAVKTDVFRWPRERMPGPITAEQRAEWRLAIMQTVAAVTQAVRDADRLALDYLQNTAPIPE